ncbi:MAG TPA: helicase HerA-like domain-containing protein [Saprospiraceae bacterium]|nr:helicase HerA-like domain-containing protein [Saprospiraceae bacterium]
MNEKKFRDEISNGYSHEGSYFILGGAVLGEKVFSDLPVNVPLATLNRHGLISGATGSGKTKTLQIFAEHLSEAGVPSLVMDIKGDLSGLAAKSAGHPKIDERHDKIGIPFNPQAYPVEFLSLSQEKGIKLRATVTEFGPVLLSKILDLNDTQFGVLALTFQYCDDQNIPILDLADLKKALQYTIGEGKEEVNAKYGAVHSASVGAIMRKLIILEQQDADPLFGEPSFDVEDLLQKERTGRAMINIIRLTDMQDRPDIFSTFVLQLLAEVYSTFPEEGDVEKPKLAIFIDEAHLVFKNADKALMDQIEVIIKLIRSKGVAIFFVTQNPTDVPDFILAQLGTKVQHALRAFTAKDRKAIKLAAQNFPLTDHYDVANQLTSLGIGEALVTTLNEDGRPTPLVHCMLRAPQSRMDILTTDEIDEVISHSRLIEKYNTVVDRESAHEILEKKIQRAKTEEQREKMHQQRDRGRRASREKSMFEQVLNSTTTRQIGRTVARELARGLLGVLGVKK